MPQMSFSELNWDDAVLRIDGVGYLLRDLDFIPDTRGTPFIAPGQTPIIPEDRYGIIGQNGHPICQIHVSNYEKQNWWRFQHALRTARGRRNTNVLHDQLQTLPNFGSLHGSIEYVTASADAWEDAARSSLQAFRTTHRDVDIVFADYQPISLENKVSVLILYLRRSTDNQ